MYKAVHYVGGFHPGDMIPEGRLSDKRASELEKMGAIMKVHDAPNVFPEGFDGTVPAGTLDDAYQGEAQEACDSAGEEAAAEEAEAPEIDLMDAIVADEADQEAPKRRSGRQKK